MRSTVRASVHSVVIGRGDFTSYLYSHTSIEWSATPADSGTELTYAIVRTDQVRIVSEDDERAARSQGKHIVSDMISEAKRLATYQCERLQSGLWFAIVAGDRDEAFFALGQQLREADAGRVHFSVCNER